MAEWIAPATKLEKALAMLKPCSSSRMVAYPLSNLVNNARHDGPKCVARVNEMGLDQFLGQGLGFSMSETIDDTRFRTFFLVFLSGFSIVSSSFPAHFQ